MQVERREVGAPVTDGDVLKKQAVSGSGREVPEDGPASPGQPSSWPQGEEQRPVPPSAYLLANRYILLDPPEGCPLHTCIDVTTEREMVCRVSQEPLIFFFFSIVAINSYLAYFPTPDWLALVTINDQ